MNQIREIQRINDEELSRGIAGTSASWHTKYANSAWCFVGNLDIKLTEGDVLAVLSEYGEIDDLHLVREDDTGKSKGFCFVKYEDARSCVLAVDNLCGVQLLGRSMRVDHVENYRLPKSLQDKEEELQKRLAENKGLEGHAYEGVELANDFSLGQGQDLFAKPTAAASSSGMQGEDGINSEERRRLKEEKRQKKEVKKREKESRKRERAEIRMQREEKRREKRAKMLNQEGNVDKNDDRIGEDRKHRKKRKESRHRSHSKSDSRNEKKRSRSDDRTRSRSRS